MKKSYLNHLYSLLGMGVFCFLLIGSATQSKVPKTAFSFSYTARQSAAPGSANTSIILIRPHYATNWAYSKSELFQNYGKSFAADLEALLIARGFTLSKSYDSYDEIIFSDKKEADIMLKIEIKPDFTASTGSWSNTSFINSAPAWKYKGVTNIIGKINLTGSEPLTGEKIWAYSLDIPEQDNIQLATLNSYNRQLTGIEMMEDVGFYNPVGSALQASYQGIMTKIENKLDPEEFKALKPQIKELKAKRGYDGNK
jgi:hypothetical protein